VRPGARFAPSSKLREVLRTPVSNMRRVLPSTVRNACLDPSGCSDSRPAGRGSHHRKNARRAAKGNESRPIGLFGDNHRRSLARSTSNGSLANSVNLTQPVHELHAPRRAPQCQENIPNA
jgi:hypothetical protein